MTKIIGRYFEFEKHRTNFRTEFIAGFSTFLSLAYIFAVNPAILSEGGINKSAALFATVIISAGATVLMGLWPKKPFALAPGLEINGYVVYFLILGLGISWQESLGIVFWSGILFLVLTATNVRKKIIEAIPDSLKIGLAAAVGMFLIIIAFKLSDIFIYDKIKIVSIADPFTPKGLILLAGFVIAMLQVFLKGNYFIILSIALSSLLAHRLGLGGEPGAKVGMNAEMFSVFAKLDLSVITNMKFIAPMIILFVIDFYGSIAKFIGLTRNTSILENGKFTRMKEALLIDGAATTIGATVGTTSIVAFVESGVGIGAGGRTGLTAVVCGIFMLLFIPLAPLVNLVPVIASTGVLLWVGLKLLPDWKSFPKLPCVDVVAITLMILVTLFTFSLDKAMLLGFSVYVTGLFIKGQGKQISKYLLMSILLILISMLLSIFYV